MDEIQRVLLQAGRKDLAQVYFSKFNFISKTKKADKQELYKGVIDLLNDNPNPPDSVVHDWAKEHGYEPSAVETEIYRLATLFADFLKNGFSVKKGTKEKDVDAQELKWGIEIEKEHAEDIGVRTRISLDHLAEIPDYYTRLRKMESEAKAAKKAK